MQARVPWACMHRPGCMQTTVGSSFTQGRAPAAPMSRAAGSAATDAPVFRTSMSGTAPLPAAHLREQDSQGVAVAGCALDQSLHLLADLPDKGHVSHHSGSFHSINDHMQAGGALYIGSLQPDVCKCLSDSGVDEKAAMSCNTLQTGTASSSAAAQQAAAGRALCTALPILPVAQHAVQPDSSSTAGPGPGDWLATKPNTTPGPPSDPPSAARPFSGLHPQKEVTYGMKQMWC